MANTSYEIEIKGYKGTVIIPDNFNGEWLWKTEFFYAFDAVEQSLLSQGFARAYFSVSNKYGSPESIDLMYEFYKQVVKKYKLNTKCYLIGFSRGGLYAFNFAKKHPECVKKMYLDAPVLDLRTWPRRNKKYDERVLYHQVLTEYHFKNFFEYYFYNQYPVKSFKEYFKLNIPTLLVAGKGDTTVTFFKNSDKMIKYAEANKIENFYYYIKEGDAVAGGDHHPHSFGNVGMKLCYGCDSPKKLTVTSNVGNLKSKVIGSDTKLIEWFFKD